MGTAFRVLHVLNRMEKWMQLGRAAVLVILAVRIFRRAAVS